MGEVMLQDSWPTKLLLDSFVFVTVECGEGRGRGNRPLMLFLRRWLPGIGGPVTLRPLSEDLFVPALAIELRHILAAVHALIFALLLGPVEEFGWDRHRKSGGSCLLVSHIVIISWV